MLRFVDELRASESLSYDVCIVGSGPAGMLLARQLGALAHLRVAVLESGDPRQTEFEHSGSRFTTRTPQQLLYEGDVSGWIAQNDPTYLTHSRLRACGGTSRVWSGWAWPLEWHDLNSEWPITMQEIEPYIRRAHCEIGLGLYEYDDLAAVTTNLKRDPLEGSPLRLRILRFHAVDFWRRYIDWVQEVETVDFFANANVLSLIKGPNTAEGQSITACLVQSIENRAPGRQVTFEAKWFFLAAGTLENTRLVLVSGLGTKATGTHFHEHFYMWTAGRLEPCLPQSVLRDACFGATRLIDLDGSAWMAAIVPRSQTLSDENIGNFRVLLGGAPDIPGTINLSWEQEPQAQNSISLGDRLDLLRSPRIRVFNEPSDRDRRTLRTALRLIKSVLESSGIARHIRIASDDVDPWSVTGEHVIVPGNHPMGTLAMHRNPERAVTTPSGRLIGTQNVYVLSAATFPTGGYANPTLTLIALALRLADYFVRSLSSDGR